ncbi:Lipoprotein NlpD [Marinobacterium lacunae]|uniref:Lipoprotein NlpD n=1 Tax=Marinobacterium lacunae TaxID=1232683 RepID=A0A081G0P8_9GAMM|nr:peptidoglycan DD-metalloendopeptidase family protein [Marinobacterium lacunae]KEA64353.1 Lipoprotein NlpD [Marinobacterium lacunae]MBR9883013.1 peptidoglycan DD-metalloendopeptidase family protein [Oceanospirillales bacterium]
MQRLFVLLAVFALAACSGGYAPVTEQSLGGRSHAPAPARYTVRQGDTLYSIAWRYGLDYRQLASMNGIDSRYTIYPGQKLRLKGGNSSTAPSSGTKSVPETQITSTSPSKQSSRQATTQKPVPAASASGPVDWQWPSSGALIGRFSNGSSPNKGIDLAGKIGDPVYAAASGRVVYAGSGLLGYGNLVIVNHNRQYLSAYAHNSRIFVKESDSVKKGDKIAEMGNTGASRPMLHFEIRRDGKPVDPLKYLPVKQ